MKKVNLPSSDVKMKQEKSNKKKRINFLININSYEKLKDIANKEDLSITDIIKLSLKEKYNI